MPACAPAKTRVLFVDDEKTIADTAVMILNRNGYDARAAYSGEGALELAPSFKPDILMCDIVMADLNGIEAAIRLHDILPSARIFLNCGWAGAAELLENARDRGYEFEIMPIPVSPEQLLSLLSSPGDPQNIYRADCIRKAPHSPQPDIRHWEASVSSTSAPADTSSVRKVIRRLFRGKN